MDGEKWAQRRLDYAHDIKLFETARLVALANPNQGRSHLIIRARPDIEFNYSFRLDEFPQDLKNEFWFIVQNLVTSLRETIQPTGQIFQYPSMLCHHFGEFRSASHFHVHVLVSSQNFGRFVSGKMENPRNPMEITEHIERKCQTLIKRHFEYKDMEIKEISAAKRRFPELCPTEWEGYKIEIHPYFPRINFIPKTPLTYDKDPKIIVKQLQHYRQSVFDAMVSFAKHFGMRDFRTWQKLSGDVFLLNKGRGPNDQIFGILQPYSPDLYAIHPQAETWLYNWIHCAEHPENELRFKFDPLSCV